MKRFRLLLLTLSLCLAGAMCTTLLAENVWNTFYIQGTTADYVPVSNITGVPTTVTVGTEFTLTGTIVPTNATSKTIVWSVKNQGTTALTMTTEQEFAYVDGILTPITHIIYTPTAPGTVIFTATVKDGIATGTDYTQDFSIVVTAPSALSVSASSLSFSYTGGQQTFEITSNTTWSVSSDASWLTVTPASGSNGGTISVTATPNTGTGSRTATVTVSGDGVTAQTVSITQDAHVPSVTYSLALSATSLNFAAAGEQQNFTITSNTTWTVSSSASWLTVLPASGSNNGTITVTAAANTSTSQRTATVTVSGNGVAPQTISVTQGAYVPPVTLSLTVSATSLNFAAAGEQQAFTITSNTTWSVSSSASWLTVSTASGSNDGTITVTATANTSTSQRTATVTVSGNGVTAQTVSVTQGAYVPPVTLSLTVSATSLNFAAAGEQQNFTITSNTTWSVSSSASWLTVAPASGSNGGTITVTAAANTSTSQRTATVTVSGNGVAPQTISVTQGAYVPPVTLSLTVSATSLNFAAAGEQQAFTITSNTTWTVSSSASWLTVSTASGSNDGTITVTATANTSTSQRTATVTVSGNGVTTQTVSITQDGVYIPPVTTYLTVSTTSLSFEAAGGQQTFTITSNTDWTVTAPNNSNSWLTISPTYGNNDGTITVTVDENKSAAQRTTTITVSGGGIVKIISVKQAPKETPAVVPQGKDPSNNGNGNKKGTIEINLSIPAEAMVTGSFEVEFPDGMTLDEQLTALSSGFSNKYKLTFTYMSDNTWLITIQSNGLKSGTTTEYIKIMDITYTVDNKVPVGDYEIWLKNIDLMMSDGTPIATAWLFVPVHVRQTTGNETVSGNSFFAYPINNNMLRVHSAHKEYISVYSLTGVRFYYGMKNDDTVDIPVSSQPGTIWIVTGSKSGSIKVAR